MVHFSLPEREERRDVSTLVYHPTHPRDTSPLYIRLPTASRVHRVVRRHQADGHVYGPTCSSERRVDPRWDGPERCPKRVFLSVSVRNVRFNRGLWLLSHLYVSYSPF